MVGNPTQDIRSKVIATYSQVAVSAENHFKYPVGLESLRRLNYQPEILEKLPHETRQHFSGVGNPFSLGSLRRGESVVDVGCGAGVDCLVASSLVGPSGAVVGIDGTEPMIERARENLSEGPFSNVRFLLAEGEQIPLPDFAVDVVISNGAINLSPDKALVLSEIYRVMRPGGRLMMADMFLEEGVSQEEVAGMDAWSHSISGALPGRDFLALLNEAGFVAGEFVAKTGYKTSRYTLGYTVRACKPAIPWRGCGDSCGSGGER